MKIIEVSFYSTIDEIIDLIEISHLYFECLSVDSISHSQSEERQI